MFIQLIYNPFNHFSKNFLFIVFDIEAMFLFPWAISLSHISSLGFWSMFDFIVELGVGYVYAWKIGALEWE